MSEVEQRRDEVEQEHVGVLEDIHKSESGYLVTLDVAPFGELRKLSSTLSEPGHTRIEKIAAMRTYVVQGKIRNEDFDSVFHQSAQNLRRRWFWLRRGPSTFSPSYYEGLKDSVAGHHVQTTLTPLSPAEKRNSDLLLKLPPIRRRRITTVLPQGRTGGGSFLAVFKVGQGQCTAVCDAASGQPIAYFDFGAGCYWNSHTRPAQVRFCFARNPVVILSHWDADHYMGACLLDVRAQDAVWVTPPLKDLGPTALKFAAGLQQKGNLVTASRWMKPITFSAGTLAMCSGTSRNDSGIAFVASLTESCDANARTQRVLIPGDADYSFLPAEAASNIDGLVLTHHGGRTNNVPFPVSCGIAAVSYGNANTYDHPKDDALRSHEDAFWKRPLRTPDGHIGLGCALKHRKQNCAGTNCDLNIQQPCNSRCAIAPPSVRRISFLKRTTADER